MLAFLAIVLGVAILIGSHEASHMIVAKRFGVKVLRFSLGFGPILFAKKFKDTSYELRLLPLGGFVQCAGETPGSKVKGGFFSTSWWKRALIALAGPITNLLLGFLLIYWILLVNHWSEFGALTRAVEISWKIVLLTLQWLVGFFYHTSKVSDLSGPVAITHIMVQSLKENFLQFIWILAAMSMSLGLFNLFPIPGLDGGHIFLYLLEGLRGKQFSSKVYTIWGYFGFILLVSLMVFITVLDLLK